MTTRYLGMNRNTGRAITDAEHIRQSVGDILRTPVGSRVMRRDYGSLLSAMIDQPQTPALELQIKVACYMAILKWEPRNWCVWRLSGLPAGDGTGGPVLYRPEQK